MPSRGIVCTKIGPWRDNLAVNEDVESVLGEKFVPQEGFCKLKVLAGGLCFPDVLMVEGKHMMKKPEPHIPCSEVAGIILEIGAGSRTELKVGQKVFGFCTSGSLAQECIAKLDDLHHIPDSFPIDAKLLAGFETNYGTTYHALVDQAKIQPGEVLLVLGASGGVGMTAIDIGKAFGCKVVAAASTEEKLKACKSQGADVLLNYSKKGLKELLKENNLYGALNVVYDPVGGPMSEIALRALGFGGRFCVIGFAAGGTNPKSAIPKIPLNLALLNERQIIGCLWGGWRALTRNEGNKKNMQHMLQLMKEGKLRPTVSRVYALEEYGDAIDAMFTRKVVGKILIDPFMRRAQL